MGREAEEAARVRAMTARVTTQGNDGENDEIVQSDSMLQRKTTPAPPQPPIEDSVESGDAKDGGEEDDDDDVVLADGYLAEIQPDAPAKTPDGVNLYFLDPGN